MLSQPLQSAAYQTAPLTCSPTKFPAAGPSRAFNDALMRLRWLLQKSRRNSTASSRGRTGLLSFMIATIAVSDRRRSSLPSPCLQHPVAESVGRDACLNDVASPRLSRLWSISPAGAALGERLDSYDARMSHGWIMEIGRGWDVDVVYAKPYYLLL
ncbi:hypothetical protein F5B19DRAFT_498690 [Rostrohypoxylon terebratum]|nr:hypothetical protein F5B19DRAFT_498690 [Rostrohypoxylon terebratum]